MIETAVISGLFGFWFWTVLNDDVGILAPLNKVLQKNRHTLKFLRCPWCSGAWFAIVPSLVLIHDPLTPALITAFAAAAVTGVLGTFFGE